MTRCPASTRLSVSVAAACRMLLAWQTWAPVTSHSLSQSSWALHDAQAVTATLSSELHCAGILQLASIPEVSIDNRTALQRTCAPGKIRLTCETREIYLVGQIKAQSLKPALFFRGRLHVDAWSWLGGDDRAHYRKA